GCSAGSAPVHRLARFGREGRHGKRQRRRINRNGGFLRNDGFQVYDCIDADLRPFANDGEVEYPCACGQEDLVFDGAAEERGVGADEYCIANLNRVLSGGSHLAATEMTLGELSWKSKAKRSLLPAHRAAWVPQSPKKWHWQAPASFSCSPATKTS